MKLALIKKIATSVPAPNGYNAHEIKSAKGLLKAVQKKVAELNMVFVDGYLYLDADVNSELLEYEILCSYKGLDPEKHVVFECWEGDCSDFAAIFVSQEFLTTPTSDDCPL